jgi:cytochrome c oxidase cbb3-type subunit I/II
MYMMRAFGGALYLAGVIMMAFNLIKTAKIGKLIANEAAEAAPLEADYVPHGHNSYWHKWIERKPIQMLILALIVVGLGGLFEIIPTFSVKENIPTIASVKPYSPLELEGRDIYIREGCVSCHSQLIRPFRSEVQRYDPVGGEYSKPGEFVYDHPFLWGSKRTGPDLAREGGKNPNYWHYWHMKDPQITSDKSIMPAYPHLHTQKLNTSDIVSKINAMRTLGVPYAVGYEKIAEKDLENQAQQIADGLNKDLSKDHIQVAKDDEIIALIAYLQRLGKDIQPKQDAVSGN